MTIRDGFDCAASPFLEVFSSYFSGFEEVQPSQGESAEDHCLSIYVHKSKEKNRILVF